VSEQRDGETAAATCERERGPVYRQQRRHLGRDVRMPRTTLYYSGNEHDRSPIVQVSKNSSFHKERLLFILLLMGKKKGGMTQPPRLLLLCTAEHLWLCVDTDSEADSGEVYVL